MNLNDSMNFLIVYYMWPIYPDDSDLVTFYTM